MPAGQKTTEPSKHHYKPGWYRHNNNNNNNVRKELAQSQGKKCDQLQCAPNFNWISKPAKAAEALGLPWLGLMYVHGIREIQLLWMIKQQKAPRILLQLVVVASYSDLWLAFSRTMSTKGIGLWPRMRVANVEASSLLAGVLARSSAWLSRFYCVLSGHCWIIPTYATTLRMNMNFSYAALP